MPSTSADPVPSGVPFAVTSLGEQDKQAGAIADFEGDVVFVVDMSGHPRHVHGVGSLSYPKGALVHEKDLNGKDVRCWEISAVDDGSFAAMLHSSF